MDASNSVSCPTPRNVPDWDEHSVNAFVDSVDVQLGEDDDVVGVEGAIGDPILLRQWRWRVDDQFVSRFIVDGSGFHLNGVIAVTQLGETEASNVFQRVDSFDENVVVPLCADFQDRPAKQVELDGHLRRHGTVNDRRVLMGRKYLIRIINGKV